MNFFHKQSKYIFFWGGGGWRGCAGWGGGASGGRRGRWIDKETDPNRFAPFGWGGGGVCGWVGGPGLSDF